MLTRATRRPPFPNSFTDCGVSVENNRSRGITSGIWLQTARSGLHIFNALDENGLSNEPPLASAELRRLPI